MDANCVQNDDLEDFMCLITKWSILINPPDGLSHSDTSQSESEQPDKQAWVLDDYKSDLAHMKHVISNITLNDDINDVCKNLGKVASALQLSHVSYSTVADVFTGLQDTERVARRISRHLDGNIAQTRRLLSDIRNYINVSETAEQLRNADLIDLNCDFNDLEIEEAELLAKKKISKYSSITEANRVELEAAGVFLLSPPETAASATSPNGTGPLPHTALLAYSSIINAEDERQLELLRKLESTYGLEGTYGAQSFLSSPADRAEVEREIESLRGDCEILEEQLREATS